MYIARRVAILSMVSAGVLAAANLTSNPASAQDVIKIGTPLALTGGLADEGKKQQIAYDMWLRRVNAAGGINVGGKMMKVELIVYDYQTDGKRAAQLTEKTIASRSAESQPVRFRHFRDFGRGRGWPVPELQSWPAHG